MVLTEPLLFTIPSKIRTELNIDSGTEVSYAVFNTELNYKGYIIQLNPEKPFFGKKPSTYKVSSKGQIRITNEMLEHLEIQNKEELDVEIVNGELHLIRGWFYIFRNIVIERRPDFFRDTNPKNDCLTVRYHAQSDLPGNRTLRVNEETFSLMRSLFHKIKAKYEPHSQKPWVGIPLDPDGLFEETGLSLFLDQTIVPEAITIQKLGAAYLPEPLNKLFRTRKAFVVKERKVSYLESGQQMSKEINFGQQELASLFFRNGREFRDYYTPTGEKVESVELYNGDLIIVKTHSIEYWPRILYN